MANQIEYIKDSDLLFQGTKKINDFAIDPANRAETNSENAIFTSDEAKVIAEAAESKSDSTQVQLDTIVIEGDSSVEAAQARENGDGKVYSVLRERINSEIGKPSLFRESNISLIDKMSSEFSERAINAAWYGVAGDGISEDTDKLQSALNASENKQLFIPDGTYLIDTLYVKSNTTITFGPNVHFKAVDYSNILLSINGVSNVSILGNNCLFTMIKEHSPNEYKHAVLIADSDNIIIDNIRVVETGGDGVYIGGTGGGSQGSKNITIKNSSFRRAKRNGMSIVHVDQCLIENCVFSETKGIAPQFGLDIEPNPDTTVSNVQVRNCLSFENESMGFGVYGIAEMVSFINCEARNNIGGGFGASGRAGFIPSNIKFINCRSNNEVNGLYADRGDNISIESLHALNSSANGISLINLTNSRVINSISKDCSGIGIVVRSSKNINIISNEVEKSKSAGISVAGDTERASIFGNIVKNNGLDTASTYKANIHINSTKDVNVTNNIIRDTDNTFETIGLSIGSAVVNALVQGNDALDGGRSAGIYIDSRSNSVNGGNRNKNGTFSTSAN